MAEKDTAANKNLFVFTKEDALKLRMIVDSLAIISRSNTKALRMASDNCHPVALDLLNQIVELHNSQVEALDKFLALVNSLANIFDEGMAEKNKFFAKGSDNVQ